MNDLNVIDDFLKSRRIAFIGVSTHEKDLSRVILSSLIESGHDVIPVHPGAPEIAGAKAFERVGDITVPIDAALIMTPASATDQVVRDCLAAGIKRIWLHRGAGPGSVTDTAVELCRANNVALVAGECPMMFLDPHGVHRLHAGFKRLFRSYPRPRSGPPPAAQG